MKVKLLRAARIRHEAGETVEVSPAVAGFLFSTGSAERVYDVVAREIPEDTMKVETPEKAVKPKTTKAKK